MFILGMDLLCRDLHFQVAKGRAIGVRLAPNAQPLTSCVYADDLLIFGESTRDEAQLILEVLNRFSSVSGQLIGPQKSSMWFSKATGAEQQAEIQQILGVPPENESGKYLGAPISTKAGSYDFLVEKFAIRLQTWKSKLMSQAGRVVLIKSVLQSIPVYFMGTVKIPTRIIKELTGLIRRFYWGATDKNRYLAYVAWDKITRPFKEGGLAIRDLESVNEALLLKVLWQVASGSKALWVSIVVAKYLPRSELWTSKRMYRCSVMWKGIMHLRDKLSPLVRWEIENGKTCKVFSQPWIPGEITMAGASSTQRQMRIEELTDQEAGTWDMDRIIELLGHQACVKIVSKLKPPTQEAGEDHLIFEPNTNGQFSVKKAY